MFVNVSNLFPVREITGNWIRTNCCGLTGRPELIGCVLASSCSFPVPFQFFLSTSKTSVESLFLENSKHHLEYAKSVPFTVHSNSLILISEVSWPTLRKGLNIVARHFCRQGKFSVNGYHPGSPDLRQPQQREGIPTFLFTASFQCFIYSIHILMVPQDHLKRIFSSQFTAELVLVSCLSTMCCFSSRVLSLVPYRLVSLSKANE